MFKIGDFAQLGRVSTKMLRHYDEIGLLKPAYIDPTNDYRYYAADQLPRLNRIIVLRELGFGLQQITAFLDDSLSAEQLQEMLERQQAEVEQQMSLAQGRLERIAARVAQIAQEGHQPRYEVVVRAIEPVQVVSAINHVEAEVELPALLQVVEQHLANHRVAAAGSPIVLFHTCDEVEAELELVVPVEQVLPASAEVSVEWLPAVQQAACLVFVGTDQEVGSAYATLASWIEAGGYAVVQPFREVYVQGGLARTSNRYRLEQRYVIEIQCPIVSRRNAGRLRELPERRRQ